MTHPDILAMERYGYMDDPMPYVCPVCGAELARTENIYIAMSEYIACANCVDSAIEQLAVRDSLLCVEAQDYFDDVFGGGLW